MMGKGIVLPFHDSNEWDYFHIRFFTLMSYERLLKEVGFKIEQTFYDRFIHVPRWSLLPAFLGKRLAQKFPALFSMHFMVKVCKK